MVTSKHYSCEPVPVFSPHPIRFSRRRFGLIKAYLKTLLLSWVVAWCLLTSMAGLLAVWLNWLVLLSVLSWDSYRVALMLYRNMAGSNCKVNWIPTSFLQSAINAG